LLKAKTIPWVSIKRSTSGKGLHIYVPISPDGPKIENRSQHIQLSKSVLSTLSSLLSFDFKAKVDCCGTVLWIWHKAQSANAYQYYHKASSVLTTFPKIEESTKKLAAATRFTGLDIEHDRLVQYIIGKEQVGWWDAEKNMLVTHTAALAKAHKELGLKGLFFTISHWKGFT